ncbi:MAG: hypothetical protein KBT07_04510 [Clostridiales bacterium]|nr:hypothetical protein [Candidatus Scatonaster coprocaballi]
MYNSNSDIRNKQLRMKFENNPSIQNLEAYIVSEIRPPIADYSNAIEVLYDARMMIVDHFDLLCVAADLSIEWPNSKFPRESNPFLVQLNQIVSGLSLEQKAIVLYLNACMCGRFQLFMGKNEEEWLEESVACDTQFFNNRLSLARLLLKRKKYINKKRIDSIRVQELLRDAYYCLNYIDSEKETEYTIHTYIEECILGISQHKNLMRKNSSSVFRLFDI